MNKADTPHKIIFPLYGFDEADTRIRDDLRRCINRELKNAFDGKAWTELSDIEKKRFVCFIMYDKLINGYSSSSKYSEKIIKSRLNEYADLAMLEAQNELKKYNKQASALNEYFYSPEYNEDEKKTAYNEFCYVLQKYNDKIPVPSYDEWVSDNEKAIKDQSRPLPVNNYVKAFNNDIDYDMYETEQDYFVSQQEIDHIIIETLLKALDIKIDVKKIKKCLEAIHAMQSRNLGENEELLLEYDDSLSIDRKTQQAMIDENIEYQICKTALENLDFIVK